MDRLKELEDSIKGFWSERTMKKKILIDDNYEKIKVEFQKKLIYLIDHQTRQKREDSEEKIQTIYLYRLMSGIYTESYDSILGLSNSMLYLDDGKSQIYWTPEIIYSDIHRDMKAVEIRLRKEFMRLSEYELLRLKRILLNDDWGLFQECFLNLIKDSIKIITDSSLELEDDFQVLSGNYMEQPEVLWCTRTGGGTEV